MPVWGVRGLRLPQAHRHSLNVQRRKGVRARMGASVTSASMSESFDCLGCDDGVVTVDSPWTAGNVTCPKCGLKMRVVQDTEYPDDGPGEDVYWIERASDSGSGNA
jgi:hypothetical protein